ncbi:MAG: rod shape-determining protein RodA [Lewinellaceae bacterium]|nr:rod shape-determining protein RodA [Saprospiraceae bacterium]MCB9313598.1 rod shape-determining protein RodA [Lewinellaceae bacterium]
MLQPKRKRFDGLLLILYVNLVVIGLFMIYSSSQSGDSILDMINLQSALGRQFLFAGVSIVVLLFILTISTEFWKTFAVPLYAIAILGLILVLLLGSEIKGARSWFSIGLFSFQPAEFAKLGTLLMLSSFLSNFRTDLHEWRSQATIGLILLLPVFLILLQPDAGSALVFAALLIPLFRAGFPSGYFILGILLASVFILALVLPIDILLYIILFLGLAGLMLSFDRVIYWISVLVLLSVLSVVAWMQDFMTLMVGVLSLFFLILSILAYREGRLRYVSFVSLLMVLSASLAYSSFFVYNHILKPHQQERLDVWLNPQKCDPRGALYNVLQSKLAIASGGLEGKGFLEGNITKLNYVPEQTTDFIFCAVGEEQGFIGTFGVILLFTLLVLRLAQMAERQRTAFSQYFIYGVAGIFFLHYFINMGMTLGLVPVIGIPLPFLSYGGSSLLFFSILIAIVLKLDFGDRLR